MDPQIQLIINYYHGYYYNQLCSQQKYFQDIINQNIYNYEILQNKLNMITSKNDSNLKETKIMIVNENGKLFTKKISNCIKGMKCTDINCNDYHHPKTDLDIMMQKHNEK